MEEEEHNKNKNTEKEQNRIKRRKTNIPRLSLVSRQVLTTQLRIRSEQENVTCHNSLSSYSELSSWISMALLGSPKLPVRI